jgi:hypothetical protein
VKVNIDEGQLLKLLKILSIGLTATIRALEKEAGK